MYSHYSYIYIYMYFLYLVFCYSRVSMITWTFRVHNNINKYVYIIYHRIYGKWLSISLTKSIPGVCLIEQKFIPFCPYYLLSANIQHRILLDLKMKVPIAMNHQNNKPWVGLYLTQRHTFPEEPELICKLLLTLRVLLQIEFFNKTKLLNCVQGFDTTVLVFLKY